MVNTKSAPTGDTRLGGLLHQDTITEDNFVPANRQNQGTFTIPKTTSDYSSLIIEAIRSTELAEEFRNIILDLWQDSTKSRYERVLQKKRLSRIKSRSYCYRYDQCTVIFIWYLWRRILVQ